MAVVCACLMVIFTASVYRDFTVFKYKLLASRTALVRAGKALSEEHSAAQRRHMDALNKIIGLQANLTELIKQHSEASPQSDGIAMLTAEVALATEEARAAASHFDQVLGKLLDAPKSMTRVEKTQSLFGNWEQEGATAN